MVKKSHAKSLFHPKKGKKINKTQWVTKSDRLKEKENIIKGLFPLDFVSIQLGLILQRDQ